MALGMTERSTAELVTELGRQASRLVKDEIWLAKQEMAQKAKQAGVGAGLLGAAAVIIVYAVGVFILAAIAGLGTALPIWAAALIIGGALVVLAALFGLLGRNRLRRATPPMPTEAVDNLRQDVETVKHGVHGRSQ
jgi:Putative Actinobacterial Holin-X, holin superfamily III